MLGCSDQASHIPERSSATAERGSESEAAFVEAEEGLRASRGKSASNLSSQGRGHLKSPNQQMTVAFMDCSQCFPTDSESLRCLLWVTIYGDNGTQLLWDGDSLLQGSPQGTEADPGLLSHLLRVRRMPGWSKAEVTNIGSCSAWKPSPAPDSLGKQVPSQQGSEGMAVASAGQSDPCRFRSDLF